METLPSSAGRKHCMPVVHGLTALHARSLHTTNCTPMTANQIVQSFSSFLFQQIFNDGD
jgi:hypothetical protein